MQVTQVPIKSVSFPFSESNQLNGRKFDSISAANQAIRTAKRPDLGYYKTDFVIVWEDDERYEGRYDVGSDAYDITEHIKGYINQLGKFNNELGERYQKFIQTREI